jgi:SufS family cysteine desulfurase
VDAVHEFSAPVLTAPLPTEFHEHSIPAGETAFPSDLSLVQEQAQTENAEQTLTLSEGDLSGLPSEPLAPPPIHGESPNEVVLVNPEPNPSESLQTRRELPFGEPLGPELLGSDLVLQQSRPGTNSSGVEVLNEYSTGSLAHGFSDTPDYYFIGKEQPASASRDYSGGASNPVPTFDLESVRNDFPALHQQSNGHPLVFLDNAATTQKPQAVIDATSHFYSRDNTNIHRAAYELAERATAAFENGREKVRQFLGAKDKKEIVFVRGATEAINLVANTFGRKFIGAGDEILLTTLEHHANIVPWQLLAKQVGAILKVVPINDRGELILEEYVRLLSPRTKLVSVTHVSNALGTVNPVEQIIQLAHAHGVHVLVDGSQSTPHLPVNVQALDADFFVFSGHKVFGPTGIGALYGKSHLLEVIPPWQGGGHMIKDVTFERTTFQHAPEKFEAGTPDIAGAVGLGAAIDYLFKIGIPQIAAYEHSLLEYATGRLSEVPGIRPIGTAHNKASVLSFVIPGISNDAIASHLDKRGIAVRAGHHCALPAIRHFGLESSVRPSLAFYNNRQDVDALVEGLVSLRRK